MREYQITHAEDVAAMLRHGAPVASVMGDRVSVGGLLIEVQTYGAAAAIAFNGEGPPEPKRVAVIERWSEEDLGKE